MQWEWIFSWTTTRRQVSRDLWLWRPRPLIAHWMAYQQKPSSELGMSLPSNLGQNDHEMPPQVRQNLQPQGALSTTNWHLEHCQWRNKGVCRLPLWRPNPVLLRLLIFDTPWGSSGWRQALCAPANLVGQVFRQLDIFRNRFYDPYREAWQATVHGVEKSWTQLSN